VVNVLKQYHNLKVFFNTTPFYFLYKLLLFLVQKHVQVRLGTMLRNAYYDIINFAPFLVYSTAEHERNPAIIVHLPHRYKIN